MKYKPTGRGGGGLTHGKTKTAEYGVWKTMKSRCYNQNSKDYESYGGSGVSVCPEWLYSFERFLHDMGKRPSPSHSLDRMENSLGYSENNCRWATSSEQQRNKSNNRMLTINGESRCMTEWSDISGIKPATIWARLKSGRSAEDAVFSKLR